MANEIKRAAAEAVAIAKGERPAARIYHNRHWYVPEGEIERLRAALREIASADLDYASGSGHESAILTARAALDAPSGALEGK